MTLFIRHESGATHTLTGKRLAKLLRALKSGNGMKEIMELMASGYTETLGGLCIDSLEYDAVFQEARGASLAR